MTQTTKAGKKSQTATGAVAARPETPSQTAMKIGAGLEMTAPVGATIKQNDSSTREYDGKPSRIVNGGPKLLNTPSTIHRQPIPANCMSTVYKTED